MNPTYGDLLSSSWASIRNNLVYVAGLSIVFAMGCALMSYIPMGNFVFGPPLSAGLTYSLLKIRRGETLDYPDFFWGFLDLNRLIHLLILGVLTTILTVVGTILLVIPGIYVFVATSLATSLAVITKTDAVENIKQSLELAKGNWWYLAGLTIVLVLLNLAGALCFLIGIFITIPLSYLMLVHAAEALMKSKPATAPEF